MKKQWKLIRKILREMIDCGFLSLDVSEIEGTVVKLRKKQQVILPVRTPYTILTYQLSYDNLMDMYCRKFYESVE